MIIRIPTFDTNNIASLLLGLLLSFVFVGLEPFSMGSNFDVDISTTGGGDAVRQLIFLLFFILAAAIFIKKRDFTGIRKMPLFVVFMIWCSLSFLWADHPSISIRRIALLLITVSTIFMMISCMSLEQIINCLTKTLAILIVTSLFSVLIIPGAIHQTRELFDSGLGGSWKGVFIHKNHAGPAVVIAISLFAYQFYHDKKITWILLFLSSLLFLYFTKSKTSIALLIPSIIFGLLFFNILRNNFFARFVGALFFIFLILLFSIREPILILLASVLDNPEAFTGRAAIWDIVIRASMDYFWLGIGYGSVWFVGDDMLLSYYGYGWVDWVYTLTHAHNGYLEILISLGFVGLILCILTFLILPFYKSIELSKHSVHPFMFIYFSSFLFFSLHNMLENNFLYPSGRWFLLLIFYFTLYLKTDELNFKKN